MRRSGRSGAGWSVRRWIALGGVGAFLALDIVLVAAALNAATPPPPAAVQAPEYWADTPPAPSATPEPESVVVAAIPPTRVLGALDGEVAWRALTGSCPDTPATPELTTDGGATWGLTDATSVTGVTALQQIEVTSATVASFIGLSDDGCAPQYVRTFVAGDNFASYPAELNGSWFVAPDGAVHAPGGDVTAPCEVVSLAPRGDDAAATLCADGTVHTTSDRGASWAPSPVVGSPVAVAGVEGGFVVAVAGSLECAGVLLAFVDAAGSPTSTGCFATDADPLTLSGSVALAAAGGTVWLWVGDTTVRSADAGTTWS